MSEGKRSPLIATEDWWAVWLGLGIVFAAIVFFWAGGTIKAIAVTPPGQWTTAAQLTGHFAASWGWYLLMFLLWLVIFTVSTSIIGFRARQFIPGFVIIFLVSLGVMVVSSSRFFHHYSLEAPLVALALGLIVGNIFKLPGWLGAALRTEYYI